MVVHARVSDQEDRMTVGVTPKYRQKKPEQNYARTKKQYFRVETLLQPT